jgi:2-polyprenyl-3-methyl-5-hydroxy-6-metoxy-1,4-benzoquinol methylase
MPEASFRDASGPPVLFSSLLPSSTLNPADPLEVRVSSADLCRNTRGLVLRGGRPKLRPQVMSNPEPNGAVGYFSHNARQFHANYENAAEFKERLSVWDDILARSVTPAGLALDMGCGSGVFSFKMAALGSRVVGVDGAPEMIAFCEAQRKERNLEAVRFLQATLPNVDETEISNADLLISSSVVEYVADLDAMLGLFARLLKPGAPLVLSMPNALSLSRNHQRLKFRLTGEPEVYRHIRHFTTPRTLAARAKKHGLLLEETHHYAHLTWIAQLTRSLKFPAFLTADLFVCVFRKRR